MAAPAAACNLVLSAAGLLLIAFPFGLLLWMAEDGRRAAMKDSPWDDVVSKEKRRNLGHHLTAKAAALLGACAACLTVIGAPWGEGFVPGAGSHRAVPLQPAPHTAPHRVTQGIGCSAVAVAAAIFGRVMHSRLSPHAKLSTTRAVSVPVADLKEAAIKAPRAGERPAQRPSLWHDVSLVVKDWLDRPTGLLHYINEMPMGGLRKYEVQPDVAFNTIEEDMKGSRRLAAFGRPVPFNYGCFPQTFRDPEKVDELYCAPGDDDPLDVLDLSDAASGVGSVVQCRPLGAVCLIDEGQADWKILAVNTAAPGPLAGATSVEEVERLAPGRIQQCLQWIEDFKHSNGKDAAKLHWEIHGAERAMALIEGDHRSWKELVASAGADGRARGHWIRSIEQQAAGVPQALELKLSWPPLCAVPGARLRAAGTLAGAARVHVLARAARASSACTPWPLSRRTEPGHS
eukprot:TRINITY_DN60813_c0_g1_i1.p1 TRINITY_DN60813_c0_g1~~TRINITY_DN60813_c0_g1_i1.p1  ORF type:complete len:477 (+),score=88.20 TRINITY_DN60813_c0_g1_i1:58-1431(+)